MKKVNDNEHSCSRCNQENNVVGKGVRCECGSIAINAPMEKDTISVNIPVKYVNFLEVLQKQMLWEDTHDNDIQASPRFWVIMDYRKEPTLSDYADEHSYYYSDGDFKEFESNKDIIDFFKNYDEDDYDKLVELCMDYYEVEENEIINEMEFEDLWELVIDHLNEDGFFSDVPIKTESFIVPNTMFITKKEAKEYLKMYGYNHSEKAHTFAMTALRSPSVEMLFNMIHSLQLSIKR